MIERRKLVLKTKSPLYIGSGQKLTKKEFLYNEQEDEITMIDPIRFFEWLSHSDLIMAYQNFVESSDNSLFDFICELESQEEINKFSIYTTKANRSFENIKDSSKQNLREIHTFLKDVYGNPYIPGSSVKGAIRTALLSYLLADQGESILPFEEFDRSVWGNDNPSMESRDKTNYGNSMRNKKEKTITPFNLSQKIENKELNTLRLKNGNRLASYTSAVTCILRGLSISDSAPIPSTRLTICPKIDYAKDGTPSDILLVRECIVPETEINFEIALNSDYLEEAKINYEYLSQAICSFYELQNKSFISHFKNWEYKKNRKGCCLYFGGGAGFHSKTILQALYGEDAVYYVSNCLDKQFSIHKHYQDIDYGISPRKLKCTRYLGSNYLMGECEVAFRCLSE